MGKDIKEICKYWTEDGEPMQEICKASGKGCTCGALAWYCDWPKERNSRINKEMCATAPYPTCNGAEGCDNCEHQEEE
jgi:hypothetical protein